MRKLLLTTLMCGLVVTTQTSSARADVGIGLFVGDPTGLDVKFGIGPRSGLDFVLGFTTFRDGRHGYGHLTYLVTPLVAQGSSVTVPLRLGIGAAIFGPEDDLGFAIRAPLEIGLRMRRAPVEFYGEIAAALTVIGPGNDLDLDLQGGLGIRLFF